MSDLRQQIEQQRKQRDSRDKEIDGILDRIDQIKEEVVALADEQEGLQERLNSLLDGTGLTRLERLKTFTLMKGCTLTAVETTCQCCIQISKGEIYGSCLCTWVYGW